MVVGGVVVAVAVASSPFEERSHGSHVVRPPTGFRLLTPHLGIRSCLSCSDAPPPATLFAHSVPLTCMMAANRRKNSRTARSRYRVRTEQPNRATNAQTNRTNCWWRVASASACSLRHAYVTRCVCGRARLLLLLGAVEMKLFTTFV